jgi:PAS domain S-box-containing protein
MSQGSAPVPPPPEGPAPSPRRRAIYLSPLYLRVVATLAGALLLPAIITSVYTVRRSSEARLESSQEQLLKSTQGKATAVEALLLRSFSDMLFLGQTPSMQRYAQALAVAPVPPAEEVVELFRELLSRSGGVYGGISVLDRTGFERVALTVEEQGRRIRRLPDEALRSRAREPLFTGAMTLTGISGQLVPVYLGPGEPMARTDGTSQASPQASVRYASLLFTPDGSVAGVLVLSAPVSPLLRPLTPEGPTDRVYLVDASGMALTTLTAQQPGSAPSPGTHLRLERPMDAAEILGRPHGTLVDTAERPGILQAFARIRPAGQGTLQWTIVCERPIQDVLAGEREIGQMLLATTTGALVVALLVSLLFLRNLLRPINQLATAASAISGGHWLTALPLASRRDEVGELTVSFARMSRQLQATWSELQQTVDGLRHSESELRDSRNLLQALIEHSSAAIGVKSVEGRYLLINRRLAALAQCGPEECLGKADSALWPPEVAARREEADRQVLTTGGAITQEEVVVLPEGERTFLSVRFPLTHEGGAPYASACISTDITDRKRAEESLRQAHDELELRVEERTRELRDVHRQLMEAARVAGREEISTTILHNVGNMVSSLNVAAEVMRGQLRKSRVEALRKAMGVMRDHETELARYLTEDPKGKVLVSFLPPLAAELVLENERMLTELAELQKNLDHINNIITVQQSLASRTLQVIEELDVCVTIDEALRIQLQHTSDIEVIRDYVPLPPLHTDRHKLLQILINLMSNAQYAMRAMPPPRRLQVCARDLGARVQIQVKDTGIGIPPEKMTQIFQYGFTDKKDGHGFGLHSCALHARAMGGSLVAHSDGAGHGAVFTLELPWAPPSRESGVPEKQDRG